MADNDNTQVAETNPKKPEKYSTSSMVVLFIKIASEIALLVLGILLIVRIGNDGTTNLLLALQEISCVAIGLNIVNTARDLFYVWQDAMVDHSSRFNILRMVMRNFLAALTLGNAATQFGAIENTGDGLEVTLFLLAAVSFTLLEPALNVRGPLNLFDITCVGNDTVGTVCKMEYSNRSVKKLLVFLLLGASTIELAVDVVSKYPDGLNPDTNTAGIKPGPESDTYWYIGLLFSLLSIHLFLIVLSVIGNMYQLFKDTFLNKRSTCDGDESTFHGYNEIPIVRAIVIAAAISLISLMVGADITDNQDISKGSAVFIALVFADFVGGNEV
jgi:hypothetical protein